MKDSGEVVSTTATLTLQLYDNGKLDKLRRSWGGDIAQCSAKDAGGIANSQLSLAQFTGLFYMMLVRSSAFLAALLMPLARQAPEQEFT